MGMFVVAPASSFHHHHDAVISADTAVGSTTTATTLGVGVGVGVFPLLTTAPCLNVAAGEGDENLLSGRNRGGGIQLWQNQLTDSQHLKKPTILDHGNISANLLHGGGISGGGAVSTSSFATCHDCGNQSKKDCSYRRCRTCCKSRGFDCATHVKSTWVPASRRRERQLMNPAPAAAAGAGSSTSTSAVKKPRLVPSQTTTTNSHTSTSNTTPPRSFDASSGRQDASFRESLPGQIRAPAVFKCVRVTAVDGGEDEFAYQAAVKIGGHVFKGFLYDQGVESRRQGFPNMSELHLGSGSSSQMLDPSDVYNAATGGGLLGGSNYGNPMN